MVSEMLDAIATAPATGDVPKADGLQVGEAQWSPRNNRLLAAVAETLHLREDEIQLFDSFIDLGGDQRSAMALRRRCMRDGMSVKTKDVLSCKTLAELETCIIPCTPRMDRHVNISDDSPVPAPLQIHKMSRSPPSPDTPDLTHRPTHPAPSKRRRTSNLDSLEDVENVITSDAAISSAVVLRPKAGPLEGRRVAFVTLACTTGQIASPAMRMIPQSHIALASIQIISARQQINDAFQSESRPELWVVLEGLPTDDAGRIDRRKLRTFAQNMTSDQVTEAESLLLQELPTNRRHEVISSDTEGYYVPTSADVSSSAPHDSPTTSFLEPLDEASHLSVLSPMQQLYLRTAMGGNDTLRRANDGKYRFNQSLLLRIKHDPAYEDVCAALEALVGHHGMLRCRFVKTETGWLPKIIPDAEGSYTMGEHQVTSDAELESIIQRVQQTIDIENGPVFAAVYISTHDGHHLLYLLAHHLVVDLLSWRTITDDLQSLLTTGSLKSQRSLPYQQWIALQKEQAQLVDVSRLLPFDVPFGDYTYWGLHGAPNTYGDGIEAGFVLSEELTTELLANVNEPFGTETVDILLAALMQSFAQTFPDRRVPAVWTQGHGREGVGADVDIAETVGWFTSICPLVAEIAGEDDFLNVLRSVKDIRRAIPARGSRYLASKFYNNEAPDLFAREWPLEIIFSYSGAWKAVDHDNGMFEQLAVPCPSLTSPASDIGSQVGRIALFEVSIMVNDGQARVKWLYNRYTKQMDGIAKWITSYEHLLLEAIGRLRFHSPELTLADLPHLELTYPALARLNKERIVELGLSHPRLIDDMYPVTPVQQEILLRQARNESEMAFSHAIYEFNDPAGESIDTARLCAAWKHVTDRHRALRTIFVDSVRDFDIFDLIVLKKCSPHMLFIEVAPEDDVVSELRRLPHFKSQAAVPEHRLAVCRSPGKTCLRLDISEALCDTTGISVLFADLRKAYMSGSAFAVTNDAEATSHATGSIESRHRSLAYWSRALQGVRPCLFPDLTNDHNRARTSTETTAFELNTSAISIAAFAQAQGLAVDAVFHMAWALVLRAMTGRHDVCFGVELPGRKAVDAIDDSQEIGCNSHVMAYSVDLPPKVLVSSALQNLNQQYKNHIAYPHTSMTEVHHALQMRGGESLFNTCITYEAGTSGVDLKSKFSAHLTLDVKPVEQWRTTDLDVAVSVRVAQDNKLGISLSYRIITAEQVANLMQMFGRAIHAVLEGVDGSTGSMDLASDQDFAQAMALGAPATEADGAARNVNESTLLDLSCRQSSLWPDRQAICAWDGDLSFSQLEDYASRLAGYLFARGIGPSMTVPLVLSHSRLAIVTMLAVLKTGAAFTPIDPADMEYLQQVLTQTRATVAVTTERQNDALALLVDGIITVNEALIVALPALEKYNSSNTMPSDTACVLFMPANSKEIRGISFTHASLSTTFVAQAPAARITNDSRVLQLSSLGVDISLSEIFTTLLAGGCVCIPSSKERITNYTAAVERMRVNWSYMTPVLSRKLDPMMLPSLKTVCFRTRNLDEDTFGAWATARVDVLLAYGAPDICPLGISFSKVESAQQLQSIRRPFTGSFWVVNPDDHKRLVPIGPVGELVVESPTLSSEIRSTNMPLKYQQQKPHISALSSLAPEMVDQSASAKKKRYYKTGHRVRCVPDGSLQYVSRHQDDVEIKGRFVNLRELDKHLRGALGQGVDVLVEAINFRPMGSTKKTPALAAFIELGALMQDCESFNQLSHAAKERLQIAKHMVESGLRSIVPAYMMPEIYVPVERLPMKPSLKVDRKRLHQMIHGMSKDRLIALTGTSTNGVFGNVGLKPLPLTQMETYMRGVWTDVLRINEQEIAAADGFFTAGGDDVTAAALVAACRRKGFRIAIADVLRNASLTELCRGLTIPETSYTTQRLEPYTSAAQGDAPPGYGVSEIMAYTSASSFITPALTKTISSAIGCSPSAIVDVAEATFPQIRALEVGMLFDRASVDYFVCDFNGSIEWQKLQKACLSLTRTHPILRTTFAAHSDKAYQAVLGLFKPTFKRVVCPAFRLEGLVERVVNKDQKGTVNFAVPLTKFIYIDAGKSSTLIMRLSKAQHDDYSVALLIKDLKTLYSDRILPARASYCDFVRASQLAVPRAEVYWRSLLQDANMTQICAHIKPHVPSRKTKTLRNRIPVGSLSNIGVGFDAVLKAGWAVVLATLAASDDIVFGEVIEGRHMKLPQNQSVANVLGPTTNTIPVRVVFPDIELTPLALLQHVHSLRMASIPHENLDWLQMVQKCTSWPSRTRFSTVVQHQNENAAFSSNESKTFRLNSSAAPGADRASCKLRVVQASAFDIADVYVQSTTRSGGKVELGLTFAQDRVTEDFAQNALRMLSGTIHLLTSLDVSQPAVPSASQFKAKPRIVPLPAVVGPRSGADDEAMSAVAASTGGRGDRSVLQMQHSATTLSSHLTADHVMAIQRCINDAWHDVLDSGTLGVADGDLQKAAFYDFCVSLIPAAQLASYLTRELPKLGIPGLTSSASRISRQEIMDAPTMLAQFEMVTSKINQDVGRLSALKAVKGIGREDDKSKTVTANAREQSKSKKSFGPPLNTNLRAHRLDRSMVASPLTPSSPGAGMFVPVTDLATGKPVIKSDNHGLNSPVEAPASSEGLLAAGLKTLRLSARTSKNRPVELGSSGSPRLAVPAQSRANSHVRQRSAPLHTVGKSIRRLTSMGRHHGRTQSGPSPVTPQSATKGVGGNGISHISHPHMERQEISPTTPAIGPSLADIVSPMTPMTGSSWTLIARETPKLAMPAFTPVQEVTEEISWVPDDQRAHDSVPHPVQPYSDALGIANMNDGPTMKFGHISGYASEPEDTRTAPGRRASGKYRWSSGVETDSPVDALLLPSHGRALRTKYAPAIELPADSPHIPRAELDAQQEETRLPSLEMVDSSTTSERSILPESPTLGTPPMGFGDAGGWHVYAHDASAENFGESRSSQEVQGGDVDVLQDGVNWMGKGQGVGLGERAGNGVIKSPTGRKSAWRIGGRI